MLMLCVGGDVLGLLDRISPAGISQIRRISQLAVCDILYYMSPLYGSEVSM